MSVRIMIPQSLQALHSNDGGEQVGRDMYPNAKYVMITADSGGANGYRTIHI